jgi:glycosyltransferase involved in cell wall biosynthesis
MGGAIESDRRSSDYCQPVGNRDRTKEGIRLSQHLLCVGGEDHNLRIPFMIGLGAHGFRVTAAGTCDPEPFLRAGLEYCSFRFERFINPRADWIAVGVLSRLVADVRPDIVQTFDTKPNLLVPLAARRVGGVLVVRTINGMGWLYSSRAPIALALRPAYRMLHRLAARSTSATVFQNQVDQGYFERHRMADAGARRLIPGSGVDIDGFDQALASAPPAAQLREALGLGTSEVVIAVTRLTRQKGIPALLEAAALVHEERSNVRFLLVGPWQGEGPFAMTQAEIDRHAPYVVALGRRSDVPALLSIADVFAFPTEYREGVPRALLEAGLAGLPIVTTKMPGCREVIRDGWNGLLVPSRSPRILARKILYLLRDRQTARAMGSRVSRLVRREFGLKLTAARYAALYTELLERKRHRPHGTADLVAIAPEGPMLGEAEAG